MPRGWRSPALRDSVGDTHSAPRCPLERPG